MAWVGYWGVGGVSASASLLVGLVVWLSARWLCGVLEMWVRAHLDTQAEREERATILAVADALTDGGAAARFADGQPTWIFYKNPVLPHRALDTREAA